MVLLPGIAGDARVFACQGRLADHFDVLAADLPRDAGTITEAAEAVADLIVDQASVVVGLSFGGLVGWALASARPDRVVGLVTLGSLPHPRFLPGAVKRAAMVVGGVPEPVFRCLYRRRLGGRWLEEGVPGEHQWLATATVPRKEEYRRRLQALVAWRAPGPLPRRTLWVRGQIDAEAPWSTGDVAAIHPTAEIVTTPGGHRAHVTHAGAFNDLVARFAKGVFAAPPG